MAQRIKFARQNIESFCGRNNSGANVGGFGLKWARRSSTFGLKSHEAIQIELDNESHPSGCQSTSHLPQLKTKSIHSVPSLMHANMYYILVAKVK